MAFGALGTDTGGSVRIPSAACGTVGLKPAKGELSCDGVVPLSPTLDHVGPMARSVADVALMYEVLAARSRGRRRGSQAARWCSASRGRISATCWTPTPPTASTRAADALVAAGHEVVDVEIEHAAWTPHVYLHIVLPEAVVVSRADARAATPPATRPASASGWRWARYVLAEDYVRAMRLRELLGTYVDRALERCDALLLPTLPMGAPPLGAATVSDRRPGRARARGDAAADPAVQPDRPPGDRHPGGRRARTACRAASSWSRRARHSCWTSRASSSATVQADPDRSAAAPDNVRPIGHVRVAGRDRAC